MGKSSIILESIKFIFWSPTPPFELWWGVKYKQRLEQTGNLDIIWYFTHFHPFFCRFDSAVEVVAPVSHLLNSFRDNSEAAIKYLKADSCKGKKKLSRKRRKKCENMNSQLPYRLSADTDKDKKRDGKTRYQKRANDPYSKYHWPVPLIYQRPDTWLWEGVAKP